MIDYEKLKLAHELCLYSKKFYIQILIGIEGSPIFFIKIVDNKGNNASMLHVTSLDELITKLQELTTLESKYKIGQEVFYFCDNEVYDFKIREINTTESNEFLYSGDGHDVYECDLYLAKKSLIESQLVYWSSLMAKAELKRKQSCSESIRKHHELEDECTHEKDKTYFINGLDLEHILPHNRCIKCGEFYT